MSYITSEISSNRFSAPDVGYVLTFEDEEYYTKTEIDSNHYTQSEIDANHYTKTETNANFLQTDGSNAMTGNLDAGNNKIVNCNNPSNSKDVVNLQYYNNNLPQFGKLYVTDKEMFNVSVPANDFGVFTHTVGPFNNTGTHYIQAFITFWGAGSPPNDTSISMRITDGTLIFSHPIQTFSSGIQPSLPNIPNDHPDTLNMYYAVSFDNTNSIDVSLEVINNSGSSQDYNIYFFEHIIETKSSSNL